MAVTDEVRVRPLQPEDGPAVRALAEELHAWFDATGRAQIARDLETHPGFVAVRGDRLIGFAMWARIDAEVADLSWIGVAVDAHRRGIGTALLVALLADLRHRGFGSLEVSTVADNVDYEPYDRTRRFYRSRGFRDFRVDPRYWGSGQDRYDRLVLRRSTAGVDDPGTNEGPRTQNGAVGPGESQAAFKPA